jgi:hypothetical protein
VVTAFEESERKSPKRVVFFLHFRKVVTLLPVPERVAAIPSQANSKNGDG